MAIHFSIHAGRIPWTEEPGGLESVGSHMTEHTYTHTHKIEQTSRQSRFQLIERKKSMNRSLRKGFI